MPNITSIPRLYRFTPADYYSIRGIETATFYLSPAGNMNDIFEGLGYQLPASFYKTRQQLSNLAYMKSFSAGRDNMVLWGTYADNFSGFCTEYDFSGSYDEHNGILYHLFPVVYQSQRIPISNASFIPQSFVSYTLDTKANIVPAVDNIEDLDDVLPLYLVKGSDWHYEQEWRIIATHTQIYEDSPLDKDLAPLYRLTSCQIACPRISAVYLGPLIQQPQKDHILSICDKMKISVYQAALSRSTFGLDMTRIM